MSENSIFEHPDRIGPYHILQVIGEGGMGVVYEAEQREPVRRRVAVKMMKVGMDTKEVVGRFEAERQALAVMEHPGIAKVLDAGASEQGRPYFVMELVRGIRVDEYCDQQRLTTRQRVELFIRMCEAVQHAHQKGVIHRDLKPSNVLVVEENARPNPKIIDFGIAKATGQQLTQHTVVTTHGQALGTLAYMSPEQAEMSGLDVDTRTDVYSLGVILFELLAGKVPLDPKEVGVPAFLAQLIQRDQTTPTLSQRLSKFQKDQLGQIALRRRTDVAKLRHQLAGDLQWIVLRAMDKDRGRRYETANGLAMDLGRYLAHEPITARPPTAMYRLGRFARRNRLGVAFASTVALGLVGFSLALARARNDAEARRDQAEELIDFMLTDLRAKLEPLGRLDILDDVGQQAVVYFSSVPEDQFTADELLSRSQALYQVGSVRLDQGNFEEAVMAFEESLRLAKALVGRAPEDTDRLFGLAQSHFYVGYAHYLSDDLVAAEAEFQGYLSVAEQLVELEPDNPDYKQELGFAWSNLGSIQEARGDLEGALALFTRTAEVQTELVRLDSMNAGWLLELAEEHNHLGAVYSGLQRYGEALREHTQELEIKERLLRIDPTHAYWRRRFAWAQAYIGGLEVIGGDLEGALDRFDAAAATTDSLIASDPTNMSVLGNQVMFQADRGRTLSLLGRHSESLRTFQVAVTNSEARVREDTTDAGRRRSLGWVRSQRALALFRAGEPEASLMEAEAARDLIEVSGQEDREARHRWVSNGLVRGYALEALGRAEEATAVREEALVRLQGLVAEAGGGVYRHTLAEALLVLDRVQEAEQELVVLRQQGYREPSLWALAESKGIEP